MNDSSDPLAALDAELADIEPRTDQEAMATFLCTTIATNMLGLSDEVITPYAEQHPDFFAKDIDEYGSRFTPEFLHQVETDELVRSRLIDEYERHGVELTKRLGTALRAHGLAEVFLLVPLPTPFGVMIHQVILNHEGKDFQFAV